MALCGFLSRLGCPWEDATRPLQRARECRKRPGLAQSPRSLTGTWIVLDGHFEAGARASSRSTAPASVPSAAPQSNARPEGARRLVAYRRPFFCGSATVSTRAIERAVFVVPRQQPAAPSAATDAVEVLVDRAGHPDEVSKPAAASFGDPALKSLAGDVDLASVEDGSQGVLEQVSPVETPVGPLEVRERLDVDVGQVPGTLLERPARSLEDVLRLPAFGGADLVTAGLVESILSEPLDVEAIEDELRIRARLGHRLDVGTGEIDRYGFEFRAASGAQVLEEALERRNALALGRPDDSALFVVHHDRDVLVVPAVTELVHADQPQPVETVGSRVEGAPNDPSDQDPDGPPARAQHLDHGGLAALLGEQGCSLLEGVGEVACVSCPGHALGLHCPALPAVTAPDPVAHVQCHARQVVVPPVPFTGIVDRATLRPALTAAGDRPGRCHVHDEPRRAEVEVANRELVDAEEGSEYCGRAQGGAWVEVVDTRSLVSSPRASSSACPSPRVRPPTTRFSHENAQLTSTKRAGEPLLPGSASRAFKESRSNHWSSAAVRPPASRGARV